MLNNQETLYPSTVKFLIKSLKSNNFWHELTYSFAFTLINHLDIYDYSPSTIQSLFNND